MDSPLVIVFKIIYTILEDAVSSSMRLFELFMQLLASLAYTVSTGGPVGALMAIAVLAPVLYVLTKIFGGNLKTAAIAGFIVFIVLIVISMSA